MDAPYYNGDYDRAHPSVADHPAEALFDDARREGGYAATLLRFAQLYAQADQKWFDIYVEQAVSAASDAANLYHEALREAGECPECGSLNTDPWGGRHFNSSYGCCLEPPDPDYDADCAIAARRDPTHPDNLEMARLKR